MITQTKYRLLIWLVIILFAMNIATFASLIYHTMQTKEYSARGKREEQPAARAEQGARFFREQLNLDSEQVVRFRDINREYNHSTHQIAFELEQLRIEMVDQMGKDKPDTVRLSAISGEIGDKHEELKKLTVDYYLKMKSSCREDQQLKLNSIFREMVHKEDTIATPRGQGRGNRWRGGRE